MRTPDRRQNRLVTSRLGLTRPRRPARTIIAGSSVIDAMNPTMIVMDREGPMVENTPSLAKLMPRKVIATVPADAAITLPIDPIADTTAVSDSSPIRRYSWYREMQKTA